MFLKDINDEYKTQTRRLSDVARQLGFAAGAIIWLFRGKENIFLSGALLYSLIFLILYFCCDLLQYAVAVVKLERTIDKCEKETAYLKEKDASKIPCKKDKNDLMGTTGALKIKILFLGISYLILIGYYIVSVFDQHILSLINCKIINF